MRDDNYPDHDPMILDSREKVETEEYVPFATGNPDHFKMVMEAVVKDLQKQATELSADVNSSENIKKARLLDVACSFYLDGFARVVPSPWSQIFLKKAEEVGNQYEKENSPEYKKFLELEKQYLEMKNKFS